MTVGKEIVKTRGKNRLFLNSLFKRVISGECAFNNNIIQKNFTSNAVDILGKFWMSRTIFLMYLFKKTAAEKSVAKSAQQRRWRPCPKHYLPPFWPIFCRMRQKAEKIPSNLRRVGTSRLLCYVDSSLKKTWRLTDLFTTVYYEFAAKSFQKGPM